MKKIDSWLDIQRYFENMSSMMHVPRETKEFKRVGVSEIADIRSTHPLIISSDTV